MSQEKAPSSIDSLKIHHMSDFGVYIKDPSFVERQVRNDTITMQKLMELYSGKLLPSDLSPNPTESYRSVIMEFKNEEKIKRRKFPSNRKGTDGTDE